MAGQPVLLCRASHGTLHASIGACPVGYVQNNELAKLQANPCLHNLMFSTQISKPMATYIELTPSTSSL